MTIQEMLSRSFATVKREPALWVMGMLMALLGGGFSVNLNTNFGGGGGSGGTDGPSSPLPPNFDPAPYLALAAVALIFLIVVGIVLFLLRCVAEAGMIHGTERALTGEDVHWRDLWRAGWSSYAQRLLGMHLILLIPALLIFGTMILFGVLGIVMLTASSGSLGAALSSYQLMPLFAAMICCIVPLVFIYIGVELVLGVLRFLAARAIVMDQVGAMDAIRLAWARMKEQRGRTFTFFVISLIINAVASLILSVLAGVIVLLLGVPLALMATASNTTAIPLVIALGVIGLLVLSFLSAVIQGPLLGFLHTFWTLAWRQLNPRERAVVASGR